MNSTFNKQKFFVKFTVAFVFAFISIILFSASAKADTLMVPSSQFPCDMEERPAPPAEDNCLQSAINTANFGDDILLQPGHTFIGPFLLRHKEGNSGKYIRIMTAAITQGYFPPEGHRINPSYAHLMPKLLAHRYNGRVFKTELKIEGGVPKPAHHYALIGLEISQEEASNNTRLIKLGRFHDFDGAPEQETLDAVAHHFIIDRCYIHKHPQGNVRNGIEIQSAHTEIINSYIDGIHDLNSESHCIAGWNGPGPYKINNNYLNGSAVNILFGGAVPTIENLTPSDIEVRHNTIRKPAEWYQGTPHRMVKNLFELKNARRVLIDRNTFENIWGDGQDGSAIVFTPKNDGDGAPWTTVEDVMFSNNVIRRAWGGVRIARGNYAEEQPPKRISIVNNIFAEIDPKIWCGSSCNYKGNFIPNLSESQDTVIDHNTILQTGNIITAGVHINTGLIYKNNLTLHNDYGIKGAGAGVGNGTLTQYFPGSVVNRNAIVNTVGNTDWSPHYPAGNEFPQGLNSTGLIDWINAESDLRNYRLAPETSYRNAAEDSKDIGANVDALNVALRSSDFDSDGKTEIAFWRPSNGCWYIFTSAEKSFRAYCFGLAGDIPVASDYDGDGQTDYAVFRPSSSLWYILRSSDSRVSIVRFGLAEDIPVPSDYDGDGQTDIAVWRPSSAVWYIMGSRIGFRADKFGLTGDKPIVGDYDSDGKTDYAVWRPSNATWHILKSFNGEYAGYKFGLPGDVPLRGDFDGDQRMDIGVWRPSTQIWYLWQSKSKTFRYERFGLEGDMPIIADFNGDSISDISVWRPTDGVWYLMNSGEGFKIHPFGANGDIPVSTPFVQ